MEPEITCTLSIEPTDDDDSITISPSSTGDSLLKPGKNYIEEILSDTENESSDDEDRNQVLTQNTTDLVESLLLMRQQDAIDVDLNQIESSARDLVDSTPRVSNPANPSKRDIQIESSARDLDTDIQIESSAQDLNIQPTSEIQIESSAQDLNFQHSITSDIQIESSARDLDIPTLPTPSTNIQIESSAQDLNIPTSASPTIQIESSAQNLDIPVSSPTHWADVAK